MNPTSRIASIDMLRGFVIALMALDHTRDFFGYTPFNVEDLSATTPGWFAMRWVTHLCATVFILLAGTSAFLRGTRCEKKELSTYLITRGAMIVLLEFTWISFSWQFGYDVMIAQVLWAIGVAMMALGGMVWLPRTAVGAFGVFLMVAHNLFDQWHPDSVLWKFWHDGGFVPLIGDNFGVFIRYPLMPWVGLMALGYAIGPMFKWEAARRQRALWLTALGCMALFLVLRIWNIYGDPQPWAPQGKGLLWDIMAILRVEKYPPSLQYLLVTGAIGFALLAVFEKMKPVKLLLMFGATPMFFYIVHVALIHLLGNIYMEVRWGGGPSFTNNAVTWPAGYEPSLAVVYVAWICMLAIMAGLTTLYIRRRSVPGKSSAPVAGLPG
jgi:uncharacterized membrane protein